MAEPKRPDSIPGYTHPESNTGGSLSRGGVYKTFSEKKPREGKKEVFGTTTAGGIYSSYKDEQSEDTICPICSEESIYSCPCVYSDKRCPSGHVWYIGRDGKVKKGNPHLNSNANGCS